MADRPVEREQRVTPLELFFDLVVVFAITQVTQLMSNELSWRGLAHGMLVLAAIWWLWTGFAWLTNSLEPEQLIVRAGMFAAMAAMFLVALAVPRAFGDEGVLFAGSYLVVRLANLALYGISGRGNPNLSRRLVRFATREMVTPVLILAAAFVHSPWREGLWVIALAVVYSDAVFGRGRPANISPSHFAERYGLIVIIALGESVVALGVGAAHRALTPGIIAASILGILVIGALWWAYFDVVAIMPQRWLSQTSGATQAQLARDHYRYLHLPMIAGIVLFALGLKETIEHVDEPLRAVPAVALCGGLSLYFLAHVVQRVRLVYFLRHSTSERTGYIGPGRLTAAVAMLALIPAALQLSALASLGLAAGVCCGLIAWDLIHYREDRAEVRRARP
ncbi:MAG: low temperature requirement protein A [Actinomycetota bacterium]